MTSTPNQNLTPEQRAAIRRPLTIEQEAERLPLYEQGDQSLAELRGINALNEED